jgi:MoaA/NifB/PqqE/SkfB family radical SAM enzyme
MNIVEVKQNWPSDLLRVDVTLGNICNYQCWYCWPGSNEGNHKWPEFDTIVKNTAHLLDYYLANTDKKKFDFHIMGGEVTHWKEFVNFIKYFKERYDCIFTLTTNASKKLSWWESAYSYLDYVTISTHHEFSDPAHVRDVADFLYKKNIMVVSLVLMDPAAWDKCMSIVDYFKGSAKRWSIRYVEVIHDKVVYTDAQKQVLDKLRARRVNPLFFLKTNKSYKSKVTVVDDANKTHKFGDHELVLRRLNNFQGWECDAGVEWVAIKMDGSLAAICSNNLYDSDEQYNLFDPEFVNKFTPTIKPTICHKDACWCMFETNMPKRKINATVKKVIPIYAN